MSRNEKLFLLHNAIFIIPLSVVGVFVNFFIWEQTDSLKAVGIFQLSCAVGILLGCFLSSIILNKLKANLVRAIGTVITVVSISLIIILSVRALNYLVFIGFIFGFALGLRALAYKGMFLRIIATENREKFLKWDKVFGAVAGIVMPLLAAFMISITNDYNLLFIFIIVLFTLSIIPLIIMSNLDFVKSPYLLGKAIQELQKDSDLKKIFFGKFFYGIEVGIYNSVWPIIVLFIVGGIQNWGIFNTLFTLIAAVISYLLGRKITFSNSKVFFMIMATSFTLVGILFATNFDFLAYVIFSFIGGFALTLFDTSYQTIEAKILDRNVDESESMDELNLLMEIPLFLGRIIPFLIIVVLNPSFENDSLLRIFVIVVAAVPLIVSSFLSGAYVTKRSEDPFVKS